MKTVKRARVFHVGYMDISKKNKYSHEGTGLSVSTCPNAWRRISETTDGPTNTLRKNGGTFLVATSLSKSDRSEIITWGISKKLIKKTTVYYVRIDDDEFDDEPRYFSFDNYAEAKREADYNEVDVEEDEGVVALPKMNKIFGWKLDPGEVFDLLVTLYAESELPVDGVWWNNILDVFAYSAPRGVIFNSKLPEWTVTREKDCA